MVWVPCFAALSDRSGLAVKRGTHLANTQSYYQNKRMDGQDKRTDYVLESNREHTAHVLVHTVLVFLLSCNRCGKFKTHSDTEATSAGKLDLELAQGTIGLR